MKAEATTPDRASRLVLSDRTVDARFDVTRLSRFDDDVWDLTPALLDQHSTTFVYRFDVFPNRWRSAAKEYIWTLINEDLPTNIYASNIPRLAIRTITNGRAALNRILTWFDVQGIHDLRAVEPQHYEQLLSDLLTSGITRDRAGDVLLEVRRLWSYRPLLPPHLQLPPAMPWAGATNRDLLGRSTNDMENRTPRIADATIQGLVVWAVRFVEDFAPDIVAAAAEWGQYSHERGGPVFGPLAHNGNRQERLRHALDVLRAHGRGIPGITTDGVCRTNWRHLGRLSDARGPSLSKWDRRIVRESGLETEDDTFLLLQPSGTLDGQPWMPRGIRFSEPPVLMEHLMTAVFILVAYLSGMRPGEVLNLKRDCLTFDAGTRLWTITGRHFKGVRDARGELKVEGELRQQPWVVHPVVATAVQALQELHTEPILFPRTMRRKAKTAVSRHGEAITSAQVTAGIALFTDWVNRYCLDNGRSDTIPTDPRGRVSPSRFRRTLAWHIVRRPRGLVAAAIQYGHVWVQMTQGYAGSFAAGFADEIAFERWLARMDEFEEAERYLDHGGHVSGPAASEFTARTHRAIEKFGGRSLTTVRQAARMLDDAAMQIFAGRGMHCVFDSTRALCVKDESSPRLSRCQSGCGNLARTDADIADIRSELLEIDDLRRTDLLAPAPRWGRLHEIAAELQRIVDEHEGNPHES